MGRDPEPSPDREGSHRFKADPDASGTVITSRKNPLIQDLRALLHASSRRTVRCVVEGWRFLETAQANAAEVQLVVLTPRAAGDPRGRTVRDRLQARGVRLVTVSPYVYETLTHVEAPQGVLGVVRRPADAPPSVLGHPAALLAILDAVQDPGNAGAIVRTAAAAGATAGVLCGGADPYGSKAIRASAGAVFRLPLVSFPNAAAAADALEAHGVSVFVADPRGDRLAAEVPFRRPLALVFGSEGLGPAPAWCRRATRVRLPMGAGVESLGVAAAAAVLLYLAASG